MAKTFRVPMPTGEIYQFEGPDDTSNNDAYRYAISMFEQRSPEAFADWNKNRRPIAGATESAIQSARATGASVPRGLEAAAAAVGAESLRGPLSRVADVVEGTDDDPLTRNPELSDLISRRGLEALRAYAGTAAGSIGTVLGGAALGAGAGAAVGSLGGPGGTAAGAATGARLGVLGLNSVGGVGELYKGLVDEGIDQSTAGRIAVPLGLLIGRFENKYIESFLARQLGRMGDPDLVSRIMTRVVGGSPGGVRALTATGAVSEGLGETARQTVRGVATGDPNLSERLSQIGEEALIGGMGGTGFGAVNRVTGRAGAPAAPGSEAPPSSEAAGEEAPAPEPVLPPEPTPFQTPEEAAAYIAAEPAARPRVPLTDEQLVDHANYVQQELWKQTTEVLRLSEIDRYINSLGVREIEGRTDRAAQAGTLLPNLYEANQQGDISFTDGFTARDVTNLALREAGVVDPTPEEVGRVQKALKGLADEGYLRQQTVRDPMTGKATTNFTLGLYDADKYREAAFNRNVSGADTTVVDRPPDIQQDPPRQDPATTLVNTAARAATAQTFANSDPTELLNRINADADYARSYLTDLTSGLDKPGVSYRTLQKLFRDRGLILEQPDAARLMKLGQQTGVIRSTNQLARFYPAKPQQPVAPGAAPITPAPASVPGASPMAAAPTPVAPPAVMIQPQPQPQPTPAPPAEPTAAAAAPAPAAGQTDQVMIQTGYVGPEGQARNRRLIKRGNEYVIEGVPGETKPYKSYIQALKAFRKATPASDSVIKNDQDTEAQTESLAPEMERTRTVKGQPKTNFQRTAKIFGAQLYGNVKDIGKVSVKEILQNSYDAIKTAIANGQLQNGRISFNRPLGDFRTFTVTDNGVGMAPEMLGGKFLEVAGTGKSDDPNASGGFGIAKLLFLYSNKNIHVVTMKDGEVSEMQTTGEQLMKAADDPRFAPDIEVRRPTDQDLKLFPEGHGTSITITFPTEYQDPSSGKTETTDSLYDYSSVPSLEFSPLFAPIEVRWNGEVIPNMGTSFPYKDYQQFANVKFNWGNARVYVSRNTTGQTYGNNLHVLSNGLWQFSRKISKNPGRMFSEPIPYTFYVDVEPRVKADEAGYPFAPNRQEFSPQSKADFDNIFKHINAIYAYQDIQNQATSFGSIAYVDPATGQLSASIDITPNIPVADTQLGSLKPGSTITVNNGKLLVGGKELPALTSEELMKSVPKATDLKVDPALIDVDRAMVHDNLTVNDQPYSQLMREKFGAKFDEFTTYAAEAFRVLRDETARVMNYPEMANEAVGVSYDKDYRGVSIRVPFSGSFINPALPASADPLEAGYGIVGTMVHELAHHKIRNHDADFPAEMQRILFKLKADKQFDFNAFEKEFAETLAADYSDIINENRRIAYNENLGSSGQRFSDDNRESASAPSYERVSAGNGAVGGNAGAGQPVRSPATGGTSNAGQRGGTQQAGGGTGTPGPVNPQAPTLPASPTKANTVVKNYTKDFVAGPFKYFASPIMGYGTTKAELRPVANVSQEVLNRKNEANIELENFPVAFSRLKTAESRIKVTEAWRQASRTKKPPVTTGFSAAERTALDNLIAGGQRAFDWLAEAYTLRYFKPNAASTAVERARLDAFWQKHEGKHLWEIPARELSAVSPKGWAELQRLNKLRNPYYMPVIADGSHFVAAYKVNNKGERVGPPVRMIAYNPLNLPQRMRRNADPMQAAIKQLKAEFPNSKQHYVMEQGQKFSANEEARRIRRDADAVSEYLAQLMELPVVASSTQAQNLLNRLQSDLDKAQMDRIFRPNQDILEPLTGLNRDSYVLDMAPRYFAGVASVAARRATQDAFNEAIQPLTENDKEFFRNHRAYYSTPTESFGGLRTATYFMLLGAAVDTAMVNLLQPFQVTMPLFIRDSGVGSIGTTLSAYKAVGNSLNEALRRQENVVDVLSKNLNNANERAAYERALKIGVLQPLYTNESRGQVTASGLRSLGVENATKWAANFNKASRIVGSLQQQSEQINRAVTFIAAFRVAQKDPGVLTRAGKYDSATYNSAYDYAVAKTNQANFITSKEDRALIQRFTPAAEVATQFMSFPLKAAELMVNQARLGLRGIRESDPQMARAGAVGVIAMMAPLVALGGIWAAPGAELLKEALELLMKEAFGSTVNFDAAAREAFGGGWVGEAATRGIPHAQGWASLSRRVAIDPIPFNDLTTANVMTLLGPAATFPEAAYRTYNYLKQDDYWNAAATLMPRAVGNVIRGLDQAFGSQEIKSQRGNVLLSPAQIAAIDTQSLAPVALRQAIGFPAPAVVNARDWYARHTELERLNAGATQRLNDEAARHFTNSLRLREQGKTDEAQAEINKARDLLVEQARKNAAHAEAGNLDKIINFNIPAITQRAMQDFYGRTSQQNVVEGIPRTVRQRAMQEYEMYQRQSGRSDSTSNPFR